MCKGVDGLSWTEIFSMIAVVVIALNVFFSALQATLSYVYSRYHYHWSETALSVVSFISKSLSVMMANLPHPPDKKAL